MPILPTTSAAPGLDRWPKDQQRKIYKEAHKTLLEQDSEYLSRVHIFRSSMAAIVVFGIMGFVYSQMTENRFAAEFVGILTTPLILPLIIFPIIHKKYRNERIGRYLQTLSPP